MKKTILTLLLAVSISSLFTACSTKRYGRLQNITSLESEYLTCNAIKVELQKAQIFQENMNAKNDKWDKEFILGFLGDLGIGNRLEYIEANKSAKLRISDLKKLQEDKACK